ncbi:hypothetical protein DXG03_000544 [Asterophora parasitica]|uniref:Uncharacterized protein n=1 Tax=Asterophora parasitica TaxID=117018 RepID=A0A9P7K9U9_9AGAR|nr:hypothetical protein DXG03_000544 [Asterophora parasitica]
MKSTQGAQHECVVTKIHDRTIEGGGKPCHILLERSGGNLKCIAKWTIYDDNHAAPASADSNADASEGMTASYQVALDAASQISDRSKEALSHSNAADSAKELWNWKERMKNLVYTVTFTDKTNFHIPSVADLVIAANLAHEEDQLYSLLVHQCYWFADTVMAIVESLIEERYWMKESSMHNAERCHDLQKTKDDMVKDGTFKVLWVNVPVHNRSRVPTELKAKFLDSKKHMATLSQTELLSELANAKAGLIDAEQARRKAEEAKRNAEEAKHDAEEAKHKAEASLSTERGARRLDAEARHDAEEAKHDVEEAKRKAEASLSTEQDARDAKRKALEESEKRVKHLEARLAMLTRGNAHEANAFPAAAQAV